MNPVSLVIIGITAMLGMAIAIILFVLLYQRKVIQSQLEIEQVNQQRQQELLSASINSEEEERRRIASELHDDIGASLSALKLQLYPDKSRNAGQMQLLDETIQKVRNISHKLTPAILEHLGLEKALESFAKSWNPEMIHVQTRSAGLPINLGNEEKLGIYRIIQELVANAIRHGKASRICIQTTNEISSLNILLQHDGENLSQQQFESLVYKDGATGLKNITNRIRLLQASINYFSRDNGDLRNCIEIKKTKKIE